MSEPPQYLEQERQDDQLDRSEDHGHQPSLTARVTEAAFLHRASRTAILADLIQNFEPERIASPFWRFLVRISGAADPDA